MHATAPLEAGEFAKYQALGNDYIVLDGGRFGPLPPERVRVICHRQLGVGSDGILVAMPSQAADLGLRIFNPDGSEAEKSGNGLRIFARCMFDLGYIAQEAFSIETPGGTVQAALTLRDNITQAVRVDMGHATFESTAIPMTGAARQVVGETLHVDGQSLTITAVNLGNPHCVHFVTVLDEAELRRLGPLIEKHPSFTRRTNVQWAQVINRGRIDVRIWERGAGETLASGSSSCAVAAAAVKAGYVDSKVQIHMPGGVLLVEVSPDYALRQTGPAAPVCRGKLLF